MSVTQHQRGRAIGIRLLLGWLFVWFGAGLPGQQNPAPASQSDAMEGETVVYCLGCHGTQPTGNAEVVARIRAAPVDAARFSASAHGDKSCIFCHYGFSQFPHTEKVLQRKKPQCSSCHRGAKYEHWGFPEIKEEFDASIHKTAQGDAFTCFSCHDPHTFQPSRDTRSIPLTVEYSNSLCIECHRDQQQMQLRFGVTKPALETIHAFLPNRELHWRTVRCLDCHTAPNQRMVSHKILPKAQAVRNCVECHSQESRLLTQLYIHRVKEERQTAGFLNSVVLNDAYVVGMTRNRYLDAASIALAAITFAGIFLHALGRFVAGRRGKRS
ncbi:MAG: hypothetical protein MUF01_05565 [Bryobacterales bacterium]|jgi:hypothetical protein|nr:hypothetical protein [Bryobacterales bacterium]